MSDILLALLLPVLLIGSSLEAQPAGQNVQVIVSPDKADFTEPLEHLNKSGIAVTGKLSKKLLE